MKPTYSALNPGPEATTRSKKRKSSCQTRHRVRHEKGTRADLQGVTEAKGAAHVCSDAPGKKKKEVPDSEQKKGGLKTWKDVTAEQRTDKQTDT